LPWANKTGELTEPNVHLGFVPVDKQIDDKKMGRIPRSEGNFFVINSFVLSILKPIFLTAQGFPRSSLVSGHFAAPETKKPT
jgi:hypothetical protein